MGAPRFTAEQDSYWKKLRALFQTHEPHVAVRQFALDIIEALPDENQIVINSGLVSQQLLKSFDETITKKDYIAIHRCTETWGEDAILYPLLKALGYNLTLKAKGKTFEAFTQHNPSGLKIKLVHRILHGCDHFELDGEVTIGDGNCMYRAVAQQIAKDFPGITRKARKDLSADARAAQQKTSIAKKSKPIEKEEKKEEKKITIDTKKSQIKRKREETLTKGPGLFSRVKTPALPEPRRKSPRLAGIGKS